MLKKNFFQKSGQLCPKVPQTNQDELSPAHELPKLAEDTVKENR